MLHHTWLAVWPKFPSNVGPWWVGWMLYGHLAVAVFIVISGFSLALGPMRSGGNLTGGTRRFLRRRAWRIISPFWASLVISTIVTALILRPNLAVGAVAKGFAVHGLLVQDIVGSVTPNGAFWSIAVEWQIYFLFPVILLLARKTSVITAVACTVAIVVLSQVSAAAGSPIDKIHHLSPQFLALFVLGVLAARLGHGERGAKLRRPLMAVGLTSVASFLLLALLEGSVWIVNRYFWIDLVFGVGTACLMAVMFGGGLDRVRRVLSSRVGIRLGLFSYSIYLLHGPLVALLHDEVFGPLHLSRLVTFALLIVLGIPAILVFCYSFHLVFEAPFLSRRGLTAIQTMPIIGRLLPKPRGIRVHPPAATQAQVVAARKTS